MHYGTSSSSLTGTQDAGAFTTFTVSGLPTGITYYFAVTAYNASGINSTYSNEVSYPPPLAIDARTSFDQVAASATVVTPSFSTVSGNELFLAFVSADHVSGVNTTVTSVTGAGLSWTLVKRTNTQAGTAEIWRALATFREHSAASTWSYRVALNTAMSWRRSEQTRRQLIAVLSAMR